jgi:SAM-dependent methyltransferase
MRAYHDGDAGATVVAYDDYERDEIPVAYFFRGPDQFAPYEQLALGLCHGRVLDVGAGSGCHSLVLQERGLPVTAIEILPEIVEILHARGVRDARVATWKDLAPEPYDTVLIMMNGIGLAGSLEALPDFLRTIARLLSEGGQVITDSTDVRVSMDPGAAGRLERRDGRYIGDLHFQLEYEGRKGAPFSQLYCDLETLTVTAAREGWRTDVVSPPDEFGHYLVRLTC